MTVEPEFFRPVAIADLEEGENVVTIEADAGEREALARRFGLFSLDRLAATLRVSVEDGDALLRLRGRLVADVTQACVVTLEPVRSHLESPFEGLYSRSARAQAADEIELGEAEAPEPISAGVIDLGEVTAEQLALELNPFPRAEGVEFKGFSTDAEGPGEGKEAAGPFAALERLKGKKG